MLTAKSRYRIACAREEIENAANAIETASSWLNMTDMSQTPDLAYAQACIMHIMRAMALMDNSLEDMT